MPHDANGTLLAVGDRVFIPCEVTSIQPGEEFCNVSLKSLWGRRPDDMRESFSAINTGVLVKFPWVASRLPITPSTSDEIAFDPDLKQAQTDNDSVHDDPGDTDVKASNGVSLTAGTMTSSSPAAAQAATDSPD